ncbi:hypothetical protein EFA69_03220 [Rufibacter immobilis]|uniref:Uncharacterized protein n=1 Tax=Rufibacter immobilis TaxID=1348778 RepID=A0A3M9N4V0_9BACT|nr:hypothetical protein EFA69_03220 [Rufibacter immobilis]
MVLLMLPPGCSTVRCSLGFLVSPSGRKKRSMVLPSAFVEAFLEEAFRSKLVE